MVKKKKEGRVQSFTKPGRGMGFDKRQNWSTFSLFQPPFFAFTKPVSCQAGFWAEFLVTAWHRQNIFQGLLGFLKNKQVSIIHDFVILLVYLTLHACCSDWGGGHIAPTHFDQKKKTLLLLNCHQFSWIMQASSLCFYMLAASCLSSSENYTSDEVDAINGGRPSILK